jgi:hypothetical protein
MLLSLGVRVGNLFLVEWEGEPAGEYVDLWCRALGDALIGVRRRKVEGGRRWEVGGGRWEAGGGKREEGSGRREEEERGGREEEREGVPLASL